MSDDIRKLLTTTAFRRKDVDELLDPNIPSYVRFDPELGYVPDDVVLRDGMDHSYSTYNYAPGGHRRLVNYAERPCRLNTYGDSFTQCQQVSDGETWQECLAAHFQEPIRNFGSGGYGVYQAYRRAVRTEATDLAAEYVILNVWEDDHVRNLDASRWIRSAWEQRGRPPEETWPLHGLPWVHLRYDLDKGHFVERPGICKSEDDLRALTDPDRFYETYKDDSIVHLFTLMIGGEAPVDELQAVADALGIRVDLGNKKKRQAEAWKLQVQYGLKATEHLLDEMRGWAEEHGKKLMILLSYTQGCIADYAETNSRFDRSLLEFLDSRKMPYIDNLIAAAEECRTSKLPCTKHLERYYIQAAGAAVFGHWNPTGCHLFAFNIKDEVVDWLDPKPASYADHP